ncbi:type VI secretion system baseplate subunit TssF [Paraburkholderia sp. BCC1885]|uniref:type VI secretion system baseplate subunit TssF n=1 Tax=Paraburkholderia sp. BCC1885 TaxID=2562669 RepID=UPI0021B38736|nr:type VI secretion system baseplate subunit TssF [Paraburkholderia sp. BCC1885]
MANSSSPATPLPPLKQLTFAFPFRKKGQGNGGVAADFTDEHEIYQLLKQESSGAFLVSGGGMWHGGIHVTEAGAGQSLDIKGGVRCIADGEVVAWRLNLAYPISQIAAREGQPAISASYSTGFVLVKHTMEFPRGTTLTFFTLYMHLHDYAGYESDPTLPWPAYWAAKIEVTQDAADKPKSGANSQPVSGDQTGLNVRASKPHGAILGILPRGTQVSLSKRDGDWGQIADDPDALYAPTVGGYVHPGAAKGGWIFLGKERGHDGPVAKNVMPDSSFDRVNVVPEGKRVKVKAGDVLGYLGRYDSLRDSSSTRMVHIEVFCDDSIKPFIAAGRAWVRQGATGMHDTWVILGGHAWESVEDLPEENLSLRVTGTNGMLPRKGLREASINELCESTPNVSAVRNLAAPTLPLYPPTGDRFQWRVLSHLAPNFLSMMDAQVLRGALALYDWTGDELNRRRLAGIVHVSEELLEEVSGGSVERGVLIEVTLDSQAFAGEGDVMLFGDLLHRFFALYAEINLFTRLAVVSLPSQQRTEWPRSKAQRSPL